MSRRERRDRIIWRFGYHDASGELHEVECHTDEQQMLSALAAACDARKASGEPQISVVLVYRVENVAPVVILTDTPAT
jgi:hypothetical protein